MSRTANIVAIGRREFTIRIRTRSFMLGTALLVIGVVAIAFLPVLIGKIDSIDATKVAVVATEDAVGARAKATIATLLNSASSGPSGAPATTAAPDFEVAVLPDLASARLDVIHGTYAGVLGIARATDGSLAFTYYSNDGAAGRTASLLRQAANAIAVGDRLDRLAIPAAEQATLFAPAAFAVAWPDPARTDPVLSGASAVGQDMLAFGMTILIFMIVVMYGNWVAMSVVEEKSSRVMEVVLNAATPFQLLAGKVLGVGSVAFLQYAAVVAAGIAALAAQPALQSALLGSGSPAAGVTQGLTPALLLLFGVFGLLGFLLYASLYAAAGSLVSRQEDVNAAVMPMTLVSMAGYLIGVYASMGLLDARAAWVSVLAFVPFLSPFMMLGRVSTGVAQPWEVLLSLLLLAATIVLAIWVAARIYAVGVLLYGQRPGARAVWRLLREGM
jgi:ABC-2 type transport system permease protein